MSLLHVAVVVGLTAVLVQVHTVQSPRPTTAGCALDRWQGRCANKTLGVARTAFVARRKPGHRALAAALIANTQSGDDVSRGPTRWRG
jgi:hypothetical protein